MAQHNTRRGWMAWGVFDYVQVGAADAAGLHLDKHVARRAEDGSRTALDLDPLGPGEYDGTNSPRRGQVITDGTTFFRQMVSQGTLLLLVLRGPS